MRYPLLRCYRCTWTTLTHDEHGKFVGWQRLGAHIHEAHPYVRVAIEKGLAEMDEDIKRAEINDW